MRFAIQLMIDGGDPADETQEIISFDRTDSAFSIDELGLTLEEAKKAHAALQTAITGAQVIHHSRRQRPCPDCCRPRWLKDNRTITVRACFGKLTLPSPRNRRCRCQAMPGFSRLSWPLCPNALLPIFLRSRRGGRHLRLTVSLPLCWRTYCLSTRP
jgi:hypothetical protein